MKRKIILAAMVFSSLGCMSQAKFSPGDAVLGNFAAEARSAKMTVAENAVVQPSIPEGKIKETVSERELSYQGEASIVTDDMAAASASIRKECKELGGYLFSMSSSSLNLRIPSAHLEGFIAGLAKYGRLKSSRIQAEDVTDKHFDLRVRISNAEQLRQRLLVLSEKSKNVKEALELERELGRVTAELERMKGLLNRSVDKVKFSMLLIDMSSPEPVKKPAFRVPFSWVNSLAGSLKNPYTPNPRKGGWFSTQISAEVPAGFASFYNFENSFWAMNGQGGYYRIQRVENEVSDGDLKFWQQTVSKFLQEGKLMSVQSIEEVLSTAGKGFQLRASYGAGKHKMSYILQVVPGEDNILVSEIWGVDGDVAGNAELLKKAMLNVKSSL